MTSRTMLQGLGVVAAVTTASVALTCLPASAAGGDAAAARQATAKYHDSSVITNDDDWFQLYDQQGITCIDDPAGGMGIHFVNGARVGDAVVNAAAPEAVIYEPQKNGTLKLVAVEYVVIKSVWEDAGNVTPPTLYGQEFELVEEGNRYGLPDFYELHAWIWQHNPNGMHEDWNPAVSCDA